jgi:hypothetical protein
MASVGDLVDVRVKAHFDGEPIQNSFSFYILNPQETWSLMARQVADDFAAVVGLDGGAGPWLTGLSVQYVVQAIEVIDVSPGLAPLYSRAVGGAGTVTEDDAMPPNDSLCVTLRSEFKGVSGRGRFYLGGFAESAANGGYWLEGTQTYADLIAQELNSNFGEDASAANMRWVILHRVAGGERLVPPEVKPIMDYTVHNEVRSLGRRAVGRRIHRTRRSA